MEGTILSSAATMARSTSPMVSTAVANNGLVSEGTPRMEITVETAESVYYTLSPAWRTPRTHSTLSPAEKADYYKAYDPLTGVKIAATLSGLLTMAVLYVFYKVRSTVALAFYTLPSLSFNRFS